MPIEEKDRPFINKDEAELWKSSVLVYLGVRDGMNPGPSAILAADQIVQAFRTRNTLKDTLKEGLKNYRPAYMGLEAFVNEVLSAAKILHQPGPDGRIGKIPAIKQLRETAGLGLKEAKEAIEVVQRHERMR